jgi:hypothetical protein
MTTRQFDPVFSAALRDDLEALAEQEHAGAPAGPTRTPILRRPQVWVSVVTALVLVAATLGLLRLTDRPPQPADRTPAVVDPLTRITDPGSPYYVARSLTTLLDATGTGSGSRTFDVPGDVSDMRVYLNCSGSGSAKFGVGIDAEGSMSGGCDRDSGNSYSRAVTPGRHTVEVGVAKGVVWAITIIRTPSPTVAKGALIDPLAAVRDLRNPDAIPGDVRPLLQRHGTATSSPETFAVPGDVRRLRVLLVCSPSSAATRVRIDGHEASGCMNAIAHWFDLTPSSRSVTAQVVAPDGGAWSLLVAPAPKGAKDSPESARLPYPRVEGTVVGRARGAGATATGLYAGVAEVTVTMTCRGSGWLEVSTGNGSTSTQGATCSSGPSTTGMGGDDGGGRTRRWTVVPHGDVSWTVQLSKDD